jgi:hypothetical protein
MHGDARVHRDRYGCRLGRLAVALAHGELLDLPHRLVQFGGEFLGCVDSMWGEEALLGG